ncbi:integrin alpha [Candidatus Margulisiibacteriota bacterium]
MKYCIYLFTLLFFISTPLFPAENQLSSATVRFTGEASNDYSGQSLVQVGDVNGDGYSDFLIGAPGNNDNTGKAYLILGKAGGYSGEVTANSAQNSFIGHETSAYLGSVMAGNGDMNNDNLKDYAFGLPQQNMVTIFWGQTADRGTNIAADSTTNNLVIEPSGLLADFGYSVDLQGDVNGDGYDDLIIGAPNADSTDQVNNGQVYLHYGKASPDTSLTDLGSFITIEGESNQDQAGYKVAIIPDLNGDGVDEIMIGTNQAGKAYLIYGLKAGISDMNLANADALFEGEAAQDFFGAWFSGLGDINGDGYGDFAIGAYGAGDNIEGKVYLYYGKQDKFNSTYQAASADAIIIGAEASEHLGKNAIANAGDVNGDGLNDIIIGTYFYSESKGKAYLILGSSTKLSGSNSIDTIASDTYIGTNDNDRAGFSVSSAGDIDDDGTAEFIIGIPNKSSNTGETALISYSQNTTPSATSISLLDSSDQSITQAANHTQINILLSGSKPDSDKKNVAQVIAYSDTVTKPITINLVETEINSGSYSGSIYLVRSRSSEKVNQISANLNDTFYVKAKNNQSISDTVSITNAAPYTTNLVCTQSGIGASTKIRLDYLLYDYDNHLCNFSSDSTQVQYKKSSAGQWSNASLTGTISDITSDENGKVHNAGFEPLYLEIGDVDGEYDFQIKVQDATLSVQDYTITTNFYVDNTTPDVPVINQPPTSMAYEITVTGSAEADSQVLVYVGGELAGTANTNSSGIFNAFFNYCI